jgi:hypothetical protein
MIYRGPGFLAVVFIGSSPTPSGRLRREDILLKEEGEGVGEEPNHTTARKPVPKHVLYNIPLYIPL